LVPDAAPVVAPVSDTAPAVAPVSDVAPAIASARGTAPETAVAPSPLAVRPLDNDEVVPPSDEEQIAEVVDRALRERIAVSLVVVRAPTPFLADEVLDLVAEAAPVGAWRASGRFGSRNWLILSGVLPKRAKELAETALRSRAPLAARSSVAESVAIGIAGVPRHARSAPELLGAAERAAEMGAASSAGDVVVLAADPHGAERR